MLISEQLVDTCAKASSFFFKYISANDVGSTGAHQAGFYMPGSTWPMFFSVPGKKSENKDKHIDIVWQDGTTTESRYIWYGKGTRSEYRLTRGFTFLIDDNVGDILVLAKIDDETFRGFILDTDDDIEFFFSNFNLAPEDAYKLQKTIPKAAPEPDEKTLGDFCRDWLLTLTVDFPESASVSAKAREFLEGKVDVEKPDTAILEWINTEYLIFKLMEEDRYREIISEPFGSVESLVTFANSVLNRRKSRAGKSLENHLAIIFDQHSIPYSSEKVTEGNKKPDFIFPGIEQYRDGNYQVEMLRFLGAKRTCKDRWRQILNEADRINEKHLFTLQQGISENQLREMEKARVVLVVPGKYHKEFPATFAGKLYTLERFLSELKSLY